jgi:hypothetical protein
MVDQPQSGGSAAGVLLPSRRPGDRLQGGRSAMVRLQIGGLAAGFLASARFAVEVRPAGGYSGVFEVGRQGPVQGRDGGRISGVSAAVR